MADYPMLKVDSLTVKFGNLAAVNHVSFEVEKGEIVGLIGPNGAGKTTCFNAITGLVSPHSGNVFFEGQKIVGVLPHVICKMGMSRTFQVIRAFKDMTIREAIRVGAYNRTAEKFVDSKVNEILEFTGLKNQAEKKCADLGLATLRRIELARALATDPKMLLLDETGAGLNASELDEFMTLLHKINTDRGVTLCVVEHIMQMVMGICQRIFVLDSGELIASGTPEEIGSNNRVIEAYLGKREGL